MRNAHTGQAYKVAHVTAHGLTTPAPAYAGGGIARHGRCALTAHDRAVSPSRPGHGGIHRWAFTAGALHHRMTAAAGGGRGRVDISSGAARAVGGVPLSPQHRSARRARCCSQSKVAPVALADYLPIIGPLARGSSRGPPLPNAPARREPGPRLARLRHAGASMRRAHGSQPCRSLWRTASPIAIVASSSLQQLLASSSPWHPRKS